MRTGTCSKCKGPIAISEREVRRAEKLRRDITHGLCGAIIWSKKLGWVQVLRQVTWSRGIPGGPGAR